ncbi:hypothetical protein [Emticicia sp. BO119]|uniref:hypothetical protein n=1 Tax=Emticicia sp. BO119 TaxID=2757768 RepID=UPI0015F0D42E|nr:hypothetical protein [Emticicia sp. BO119]MBA4848999.1 hypothetical protein [Emticicia sp. BO119]
MTKYDKWLEVDDFKCSKFENFLFMSYHISNGSDKSKLRDSFPELFTEEHLDPPTTTTDFIRKHRNFKESKQ